MRRNRHHAKGDHQYCDAGQCEAAFPGLGTAEVAPTATSAVPPVDELTVDDERKPGGIEQAVVAFVAALPYRGTDPRALLAQIAIRLAQRVDETGAMPAAVRELRVMLQQLTEIPNQPAGPLDVHRLRIAQRQLDSYITQQG